MCPSHEIKLDVQQSTSSTYCVYRNQAGTYFSSHAGWAPVFVFVASFFASFWCSAAFVEFAFLHASAYGIRIPTRNPTLPATRCIIGSFLCCSRFVMIAEGVVGCGCSFGAGGWALCATAAVLRCDEREKRKWPIGFVHVCIWRCRQRRVWCMRCDVWGAIVGPQPKCSSSRHCQK